MSDTHGMTALMFAAAGDHKDAVTLLASRGAAVDAQVKRHNKTYMK
jgi:ankyrin repeat protein